MAKMIKRVGMSPQVTGASAAKNIFQKYAKLAKSLEEEVFIDKNKNLFLTFPDDVQFFPNNDDVSIIFDKLVDKLKEKIFDTFFPNPYVVNNISRPPINMLTGTANAYKFSTKIINDNILKYLTKDKYLEIISVICIADAILNANKLGIFNLEGPEGPEEITFSDLMDDGDKNDMQKTYQHF